MKERKRLKKKNMSRNNKNHDDKTNKSLDKQVIKKFLLSNMIPTTKKSGSSQEAVLFHYCQPFCCLNTFKGQLWIAFVDVTTEKKHNSVSNTSLTYLFPSVIHVCLTIQIFMAAVVALLIDNLNLLYHL